MTISDLNEVIKTTENAMVETENTLSVLLEKMKDSNLQTDKYLVLAEKYSQKKELLKMLKERFRQLKGNKATREKGLKHLEDARIEALENLSIENN